MIRCLYFLPAAVILFQPGIVRADAPPKDYGEARFEIVTIEPAAGETVRPAPAIQPMADGTKETVLPKMREPSGEPATSSARITAPLSGNCSGGLAEPGGEDLKVFHAQSSAAIVGTNGEINIRNLDGTLSYNGKTYMLRLVTLEAREFVPFSGVSFPMRIRFDYADQSETHVSVDVPVRIGSTNLGIEKILAAKGGVPLSGDELMPASRAYATMTDCNLAGLPVKRAVLTTPLEISYDQLARFSKI